MNRLVHSPSRETATPWRWPALSAAMLRLQEATELRPLAQEALHASVKGLSDRLGVRAEASARLGPNAVRLCREEFSALAVIAELDLAQLGARAHLEVELPFLVGALELLASGEAKAVPATCLTPLEEIAFAFLGTVVIARLRKHPRLEQLLGPRWVRIVSNAGPLAHEGQQHLVVSIQLSIGGLDGLVRLWLPVSAVCQAVLLERPATAEPLALPRGLAEATLAVLGRLGRAWFDRAHCAQLNRGDVILFEGLSRESGGLRGPGRLLTPSLQVHGRFEAAGFLIQQLSTRACEGAHMNGRPNPIRASSVPIEIEVQLSRSWVSLGELNGLGPGTLLPLHVGAHAPVQLKTGDRVFATAELVDIDGQLGARILSLEEVAR